LKKSFLNSNGERCINSVFWSEVKVYTVAEIMAHSFKPTNVDYTLWNKLSIIHVDSNKENIKPCNLIWKHNSPIEHPVNKGYYYVPGYSRYIINKEGVCLDTFNDKLMNVRISNDYHCFGLQPDHSKFWTKIGIHRVLALAFLDYPATVDILQVNHIDGIKYNNELSNLEWCTPKYNVLHARENGLLNNGKIVLCRDVVTNTITEYISTSECARQIGINKTSLLERLQRKGQLVYPGNLQFKYKSDETPWREIKDLKSEFLLRNLPRPVKVKNIFTGEIKTFDRIKDAATHYNLNLGGLDNALRYKSNKTYKQFNILDKNSDENWTVFSNDELEKIKLTIK